MKVQTVLEQHNRYTLVESYEYGFLLYWKCTDEQRASVDATHGVQLMATDCGLVLEHQVFVWDDGLALGKQLLVVVLHARHDTDVRVPGGRRLGLGGTTTREAAANEELNPTSTRT